MSWSAKIQQHALTMLMCVLMIFFHYQRDLLTHGAIVYKTYSAAFIVQRYSLHFSNLTRTGNTEHTATTVRKYRLPPLAV